MTILARPKACLATPSSPKALFERPSLSKTCSPPTASHHGLRSSLTTSLKVPLADLDSLQSLLPRPNLVIAQLLFPLPMTASPTISQSHSPTASLVSDACSLCSVFLYSACPLTQPLHLGGLVTQKRCLCLLRARCRFPSKSPATVPTSEPFVHPLLHLETPPAHPQSHPGDSTSTFRLGLGNLSTASRVVLPPTLDGLNKQTWSQERNIQQPPQSARW